LSLFWLPITCENGAFYNASCPESPEDVLRFGSVLQDEIGVCSSNEGATSYEQKLGIRIIVTDQSDNSAICELNRTAGTVGSGRESRSSNFDFQGFLIISDLHSRSVGDQHERLKITGIVHDFSAIERVRSSDGSAERDTHIPALNHARNTSNCECGLSMDGLRLSRLVATQPHPITQIDKIGIG
jgi:hypothetical protein